MQVPVVFTFSPSDVIQEDLIYLYRVVSVTVLQLKSGSSACFRENLIYARSWSDLGTFLSQCLHKHVVALGLICLDKLKW